LVKINLPNTFGILTKLEECLRVEDVVRVTLLHAAPYGVESVLAGVIPEKNLSPQQQMDHVIFGKMPAEWGERYFQNNYLDIDPTIAHVRNRNEILQWSSIDRGQVNNPAATVMNEASEFNLTEGVTIPHLSMDGMRIGVSFSGARLENNSETLTHLNVLSAKIGRAHV